MYSYIWDSLYKIMKKVKRKFMFLFLLGKDQIRVFRKCILTYNFNMRIMLITKKNA